MGDAHGQVFKGDGPSEIWWEGWNRLVGGKMQEEGIFVAAEQAENARPS